MRRLLMAALTSMALLLMVAAPAGATNQQPTGDRINLFLGDQSYPASTPFYIKHGFGLDPRTDGAIGLYTFTLDVDGVARAANFRTTEYANGFVVKWWYFNFPNGMTGTHTFVGHHWAPCGDSTPCNGSLPGTLVEILTLTATVTFT